MHPDKSASHFKCFLPKAAFGNLILNSICASSCEAENGIILALILVYENSKVLADEDTTALKRPLGLQMSYLISHLPKKGVKSFITEVQRST